MILEQLDRTLFEKLRLELVTQNLLPAYTEQANPATNSEAWEAALKAHAGNLVLIYGVGVAANRGRIDGHRIVINRKTVGRGNIGGNTPYFTTEINAGVTTFTKRKRQMSTYDVFYEIRSVSKSVEVDRLISMLILKVFPIQKYVNIYAAGANPTRSFTDDLLMLHWEGEVEVKATDELERVHTYYFEDAWLGDDEVMRASIKPLTKITVKVKDLDDYRDFESDDDNEDIIQ